MSPSVDVPVAAFAIAIIFACVLAVVCFRRTPASSFGSGSNSHWSRAVNLARPRHAGIHHKLQHVWEYCGAEASGRQLWRVVAAPSAAARAAQAAHSFDAHANPSASDKLFRAQLLGSTSAASPRAPASGAAAAAAAAAVHRGWSFYSHLQLADGHFAGDYGGPLFLVPGLVIACHYARVDLGEAMRSALLTYIRNHAQEDGGWGLHIEAPSTLFPTVLNYAAARILGVPARDPLAAAARAFIHAQGGAGACPHWGRFWLALLGVFDWRGVNPFPPELWLLPRWFPFHPGKLWCHARMVLLPMSYLYGTRVTAPASELVGALREELFPPGTAWAQIDWEAMRSSPTAPGDLYVPLTRAARFALWAVRAWERCAPSFIAAPLRAAACNYALRYCEAEDAATEYICIGPVSKVLNLVVAAHVHGCGSSEVAQHVARLPDYLWVAEDGAKMQGYNSSGLWDTAFAAQALAAARGEAAARPVLASRMHAYLDACQVKADVPDRDAWFRAPSLGGWPFSTAPHGWPIADCTAEGLKAALALRALVLSGACDGRGTCEGPPGCPPLALLSAEGALADGCGTLTGVGGLLPLRRLCDAVDVILALRNGNRDGGWATYETQRAGSWYEVLNSAEVFGDLMVDYTYTELTSSALTALVAFSNAVPSYRAREVQTAIAGGVRFVRAQQRRDGAWYGSWAVCFTYGTWFGVEALVTAGAPQGEDAPRLAAACAFLLAHQREDGGWGEAYTACLTKVRQGCVWGGVMASPPRCPPPSSPPF